MTFRESGIIVLIVVPEGKRTMKRLAVAMAVLAAGCGSTTGPEGLGTPLDVLTLLEDAYSYRDPGLFTWVLQDGYFHSIPECDWEDYDGDGVVDTGWNAELQTERILFFFMGCSEITLSIDEENASVEYLSADEAVLSFDFQLDFTGTGPDYISSGGSWTLLVSCAPGERWKLLEASDADGWVGFLP